MLNLKGNQIELVKNLDELESLANLDLEENPLDFLINKPALLLLRDRNVKVNLGFLFEWLWYSIIYASNIAIRGQ